MYLTRALFDCMDDSDCRIHLVHSAKTGGKDIEARMFRLFPPRLPTCKGGTVKQIFLNQTSTYCQAKFFSMELGLRQFVRSVIPACHDISKKTRSIMWLVYREPISRFLSHVHQTCSKNFDRRDNATKAACFRCVYDKELHPEDAEIWDRSVNSFNSQYANLLQFIRDNENFSGRYNVTTIAMDTADLSRFYASMNEEDDRRRGTGTGGGKMAGRGNRYLPVATTPLFVGLEKRKNVESIERCNFPMTSALIRELKPSIEAYREIQKSLRKH